MFSIFGKTKEIESKIDEFLDLIAKASVEFRQSMIFYIGGEFEEFEKRAQIVDDMETETDKLRREIENKLYLETLIPESRGDVLALLETSDDVLNVMADTIVDFSIERPYICDEIKKDFRELLDVTMNSVDAMVMTIRAYFRNITMVRDYANKVRIYENESDKFGERIKRKVFERDIDLAQKIHIRHFIHRIEEIADKAEDVTDRVSIYAIKRET